MTEPQEQDELYGVLGEFATADGLCAAARDVRDAGYQRIDAFAPYPVEELPEAIGQRTSVMPWIILAGGICGGLFAYGLQYWVSVYAYPLNVGGRPLHSWPSFIPPTFELTVLGASLAGFFGLLVVIGLPRLHHPLFEIPRFQEASNNAFFLVIESRDERFDAAEVRAWLLDHGALEVWDVPNNQ